MLEAASPRASSAKRYRTTTTLLKAKRGSEQYQAMNSFNANSYARREPGDLRLLSTADLEWSGSGSRRMVRRVAFSFFGILGGPPSRKGYKYPYGGQLGQSW